MRHATVESLGLRCAVLLGAGVLLAACANGGDGAPLDASMDAGSLDARTDAAEPPDGEADATEDAAGGDGGEVNSDGGPAIDGGPDAGAATDGGPNDAGAATDGGGADAGECGAMDDGEPCGDGGTCMAGDCTEGTCGDSVVNSNEQCDDGNEFDGDGCDSDCTYTCESDDDCASGCVSDSAVERCDQELHICVTENCNDGDPCTEGECNDGQCRFSLHDDDEDGYADCSCAGSSTDMCGDCDDSNPFVNPGEEEVCDVVEHGLDEEVDNDCDGYDGFDPESGLPDQYFRDVDEDGYGDPTDSLPCPRDGYVDNADDCFDGDSPQSIGADVHPSAGFHAEPYTDGNSGESWDYNCDGQVDVRWTTTSTGACFCEEEPDPAPGCVECAENGWDESTVPDCGEAGTWNACDWASFECEGDTSTRTQSCH